MTIKNSLVLCTAVMASFLTCGALLAAPPLELSTDIDHVNYFDIDSSAPIDVMSNNLNSGGYNQQYAIAGAESTMTTAVTDALLTRLKVSNNWYDGFKITVSMSDTDHSYGGASILVRNEPASANVLVTTREDGDIIPFTIGTAPVSGAEFDAVPDSGSTASGLTVPALGGTELKITDVANPIKASDERKLDVFLSIPATNKIFTGTYTGTLVFTLTEY